jgi:hypothetical protein
MERADLLNQNGEIFAQQGRALNESAKADCKVCVGRGVRWVWNIAPVGRREERDDWY